MWSFFFYNHDHYLLSFFRIWILFDISSSGYRMLYSQKQLNYAYLMEDQTETKTQKRDTSEPYGFAITIPKKKKIKNIY